MCMPISEVEGRLQCPNLFRNNPLNYIFTVDGVERNVVPSAPLSRYFSALSEYFFSGPSWHSSSTFGSPNTLIGSGSNHGFIKGVTARLFLKALLQPFPEGLCSPATAACPSGIAPERRGRQGHRRVPPRDPATLGTPESSCIFMGGSGDTSGAVTI